MREGELISSLGRQITGDGPLTNLTEGGVQEVRTEETNQRISASLKQYYRDHPERLKELCEQRRKWEEDNPEEAKKVFSEGGKKAIGSLISWMHKSPEGLVERNKKHSEFMKEWHQNNREKTKEVASKEKREIQDARASPNTWQRRQGGMLLKKLPLGKSVWRSLNLGLWT